MKLNREAIIGHFSIRQAVVALAGILLIFFADHVGLFDGIDNYGYDFAMRLKGQATPHRDIVIAAVDEKSLNELGRWPLARGDYARLIDRLKGARAIGFTIIMAEPAPGDSELAAAAAQHGKVVFPLYVDNTLHLEEPVKSLRSSAIGHLHIEQDMDGIVRRIFHTIRFEGTVINSFASVLRDTATGASRTSAALPATDGNIFSPAIIVQSNPMAINYYGPAGTFPTVSVADIVSGLATPDLFSGKIVIVGATAAGIGERFNTPVSERTPMPAVQLHANILSNLLGGEDITIAGDTWRLLACLLLSGLLFVIYTRFNETGALIAWMVYLIGVWSATYLLFVSAQLWVTPSVFIFTSSYLLVATFILKLSAAVQRMDGEYSAISACLGLPVANRDGAHRKGLSFYMTQGGIDAQVKVLSSAAHQLMDRSTKLETANKEMEAFSYAVSHDLRSPLRSILGYCNALQDDCAEQLNDTGKVYLDRVTLSVLRMERLIEGLLALSRLSRTELLRETVDLSDMALEITAELKNMGPNREVELRIMEGIVVQGDANLLRAALVNLLENAWKFSARTSNPIIEFGMEARGDETCYFVRDNGAGFDTANSDKLFVPFQRFHKQSDFPGTGIGLATVQRIIALHGGRIWAEGKPGQGATFYFTLNPAA